MLTDATQNFRVLSHVGGEAGDAIGSDRICSTLLRHAVLSGSIQADIIDEAFGRVQAQAIMAENGRVRERIPIMQATGNILGSIYLCDPLSCVWSAWLNGKGAFGASLG